MLAIMSAVLVSCTKSEVTNPDANASISVSPTELNFDATGGDKTVTITSTGEWSVAYTSDDWFELSATSGQNGDKITISADPYDNTEDERYGYIDFYCGNSSTSVSITQSAKEHSVTVTPTEIKEEAEGGKYEITVTSTDEWTVTADNWITLSADKGNNGDIVTLTVNFNETTEERTGTVTFDCKGKTATITVTQQPDNSPIIQFKDQYFLDALLKTYTIWWNDIKYDVDVDKNNDGQISEKEAANVVVLSVYDVRNMDEISYFTSLEYLSCIRYSYPNGEIESLNVSNNAALTYLDCSYNKITSLDISGCVNLHTLICYENQLSSLDISNNTALTSLDCSDNQLTTLDVNNNTALTDLNCFNNQLTSLDLSNNAALTDLVCYSNQLTTLDLSNNAALTDLVCSGNQLTTLDLSNNAALTDLDCSSNQLTTLDLSNNAALTDLDCSSNQLTALDVSGCSVLDDLDCHSNPQLTSIDLSKNTELTYFECYETGITNVDLSKNRKLKTFKPVNWYSTQGELDIRKDTKCPLETVTFYKYHVIDSDVFKVLDEVYPRLEILYAE